MMFDFGFSKEDDIFTTKLIRVLSIGAGVVVGGIIGIASVTGLGVFSRPAPKPAIVANIPKHLLVRGEIWNVRLAPQRNFRDPGETGLTDCGSRTIFVSDGLHGPEQRVILLHELFHSTVCKWEKKTGWYPDNSYYNQSPDQAVDHAAIYAAAFAIEPILEDNPHLDAYLSSRDKTEIDRLLTGQ